VAPVEVGAIFSAYSLNQILFSVQYSTGQNYSFGAAVLRLISIVMW